MSSSQVMASVSAQLQGSAAQLEYLTDGARHLICVPYSVENLHVMADALKINRCWFHRGSKFPHYDVPKRRIGEIEAKCRVVPTVELLEIIKKSM